MLTLALAVVRTLIGLFFVAAGISHEAQHAYFATQFARWGVPAPDVTVWLVGAVEIVCGAMLALGALTRPVALALATLMVGAVAFAGRTDGGFHLIVPPILFVLCVFYAWRSGRFAGSTPKRQPGVQ